MSRQTIVCQLLNLFFSFSIVLFLPSSPIYAGVVINEFLPNPVGDENGEFIEVYNSGDASEDISGWKLDDASDVGSPYTIPSGISISSHGFITFGKPTTKIGLNNDGDIVQLFSKSGDLIDSYDYRSTIEGISIGRSQDGGGEFITCVEVTKGAQNNCPLPTSTPTNTPTNSPTPTNTPTNTPMPTTTPTNTPTKTPTPKPTSTLTPNPTEKKTPMKNQLNESTASGQNGEGEILGAKEGNTASSSVSMERAASRKVFIITFLFIGIGCAGLSLAIVLRKQFFPKG